MAIIEPQGGVVLGLTEVTLAVRDCEATARHLGEAFGVTPEVVRVDGSERMQSRYTAIQVGQQRIGIIEDATGSGPIARFISRRGPGAFSAVVQVDGIETVAARMRNAGIDVVPETPEVLTDFEYQGRKYAEMRMLWTAPGTAHGLLLELQEPRRGLPTGANDSRTSNEEAMVSGIFKVAIAVRDARAAGRQLASALGQAEPQMVVDDSPGVGTTFCEIPLGSEELGVLQDLDGQGPVGRFVEKRGEGLYMIFVRVGDVAESMKRMDYAGVKFLSERPRRMQRVSATGERRDALFAWTHPSSTGGLLLELQQTV